MGKTMKNFLFLGLLFLSACQTALDLPVPLQHNEVAGVDRYAEKYPAQFSGISFNIPSGEVYAVYPYWRFSFPNVNVGIWSCNLAFAYRFKRSEALWKSNAISLKKTMEEIIDAIETPLTEQGYDIVTAHTLAFGEAEENARARIRFAGEIIDLKMNVCHLYNGLILSPFGMTGGSAYVKVRWELYDDILKKRLGTVETEGVGYVDNPTNGGNQVLIVAALQEAAADLGRTQAFYQAILGNEKPAFVDEDEKFPELEIMTREKSHKKPLKKTFNLIRRGVVTIRTGSGHGSGFFINNEGYILTNYHVVGDAKTVAVKDFSGTSYMADVIRVHKTRDVALLKVDIFDNAAMSLFPNKKPDMLDTVYAIGSPLNEGLKTTVSEGIISNFRNRRKTEMTFIQASVPIAAGNSGGPLVDEFGNVIGIAVQASGDRRGTVYAYFIPIDDALRKLNIKMVKRR